MEMYCIFQKVLDFSNIFNDPAPGLTKTLKITFQLFRRDGPWKSSPQCTWEVSETLPLAIRYTVSDLFNQLFGMYLSSTEWNKWTTYSGLETLDGPNRISMQMILYKLSTCMVMSTYRTAIQQTLETELEHVDTSQWLVWVSKKYESLYPEIERQFGTNSGQI